MKLATKARYGVTAMMDLAINENVCPVTLADISQYQGISLSYLEQLFAKLRSKDLVRGVRGPGGGYRLARPASEISIAQIVSAINDIEESATTDSSSHVTKNDKAEALSTMWNSLSQQIYQFLDGITLDQFAKGESAGDLTGKLSKTGSQGSDAETQAIA